MIERALLFSDVVDSTRIVERLGDARASDIWAAHDQQARALLVRLRGREIDHTDGFFVLFEHTAEAAAFALAYHEALAALALTARIGIHFGPVVLRDNAPAEVVLGAKPVEVEGLAKPLAARVMALAVGGQTLLSAAARDALDGSFPGSAEVESHGYYRLKGIEDPIEIFELGERTRGPFAPPPDFDKAYRVVRSGDFWRPVREVRHNLPAERNAFVGRSAELRALAARLDAGTRLVTVLGPGGTGKTRIVRRYGWTWLGDWPGGVYFCDLCDARSLEGIYFAVASALEVPLGREDPSTQLGNAIAGRGRCLVILDNFEQIVAHAPTTLGRWLDRAPGAVFLVTSRERLHLTGEEIFPIEPLPLEVDAIELFAMRARAQRPEFVLNDANRADVAEVVRLLDGLPLAIELAAARVRILSPAQLVARMRDRFNLLAGARGAAARQATLRAAIDWSWDLLTPWEQAAFAQCSTFEGGFTLDAAEAVLDLSAWPEAPSTMDVVQALADKSLLRTWIPAEHSRYAIEEPFFGMYISIRDYAAEKLEASGSEAKRVAEDRHGRYFAQFGTDAAIEQLSSHGGVKRRRVLALELDNLVAAFSRASQRGNAPVAMDCYRAAYEVVELLGPCALGIALGSQLLAAVGPDATQRAEVLPRLGMSLRFAGRAEEGGSMVDEALALARDLHDRRREAAILGSLGNLRRDQGRIDESTAHLEAAIAIHRDLGNRHALGTVLGNLGIIHAEQGRLDDAIAHFEQALAAHREAGDRRMEGIVLSNLGNACLDQGRLDDADLRFTQALAIHREVGNRRDEAIVLANLGLLRSAQHRTDETHELYEAALTLVREAGYRPLEGYLMLTMANELREDNRFEEALTRCENALEVLRDVRNARHEGAALGLRGDLLASLGRFDEARASLRAGEDILRKVGDQHALVRLLCARGQAEAVAGGLGAARDALAAAEALAVQSGVLAESEPGRALAALRKALA
jgi:predicted ATPase/class 3 adenylate cyclase/Tfp pilus assembly protein PilF